MRYRKRIPQSAELLIETAVHMSNETDVEPTVVDVPTWAPFDEVELEWVRRWSATLSLLQPGQFFVADVRHPEHFGLEGMSPYFQVLLAGDTQFILEVPGNELLQDPYRLTERQCGLLSALGFTQPHSDSRAPDDAPAMWQLGFSLVDVGAVAGIVVTLIGEVFALPHPSFASVITVGSVFNESSPCVCLVGAPCGTEC